MKKHPKKTSRTSRHNQRSDRLRTLKFLPAIVITIAASFFWAQPAFSRSSGDVLAYATNTSISGLHSATNTERVSNGASELALNNTLSSAAQAKANDMVQRNYWSHQTPEGQQPWIFITNAGYQYLSAGENLAYGFNTSSATVTGWMNSPSHRSNLLSGNFTEVGFGIANSPDYVSNGQQTVVVAMYAKPQRASAPVAAPVSQPKPAQQTKPAATEPVVKPVEAPAEVPTPESAPVEQPAEEDTEPEEEIIMTSAENGTGTGNQQTVPRIQIITGGNAIWSASLVLLAVCATGLLWVVHRGIRLGHWVKASEKFIGRHIHLDLTVLAVVYLGFVLLSGTGTIR